MRFAAGWFARLPFALLTLPMACGDDHGRRRDAASDQGDAPGGQVSVRDANAPVPDAGPAPARSLTHPRVPIGLEALRRWDRLPAVRLGVRTVMRSTFDRAGGNEGADASHFVRQASDGTLVTMDLAGPGVVAFVRTNHWHGSPWHYVTDGVDHVVTETSTADPLRPVEGSTFLPAAVFPSPLAETWSRTRGADLSWVPIPFLRGFELRYERSHYGTGYAIIHRFAEGDDNLDPPLQSWDGRTPPDPDVVALVARAGQDVAPVGAGVTVHEGRVALVAGRTSELVTLREPAVVRALELRVPRASAAALEGARLRITWDDDPVPAVDAPVPLFFGTGTLFNRDDKPVLVGALLLNVRFGRDAAGEERVTLASYFPMPFRRRARIELLAGADPVPEVQFHVRTVASSSANPDPPGWSGAFHASYRDHGTPTPGEDLVVLDTAEQAGGTAWCGTFVGMSWIFSERGALGTLEGDPRFFFDDSASPQVQGTGTEEWGGGGDYWGGRTMTLPFAGHPVGAPSPSAARAPADLIESAYRILVSDAMAFGRRAVVRLEHGGHNDSTERYHSVAYWYGQPGACLVLTDAIDLGDPADEAAHAYAPTGASTVEPLSSAYELGVVSPVSTDDVRSSAGGSSFTVKIDPENLGVLLRRKLDLRFPDQRALVEVADGHAGAPFVRAGIWYTAGSDRVVYSNPPGELDPPAPVRQTSNRRWREDEMLLPLRLTQGRSIIRVRLTSLGGAQPLVPGDPIPAQAWSEAGYRAYSYVLPVRPAN